MSEIQILTEFKKNIICFIDELIDQFPKEGDFIVIRIFIKDQIPIIDIMNHFMLHIMPLKNLIKDRDENFFLNNNILFDRLDKNKVNHFKRIWRSGCLDADDKNIIWKWFDSFIYLAEKYQNALFEKSKKN